MPAVRRPSSAHPCLPIKGTKLTAPRSRKTRNSCDLFGRYSAKPMNRRNLQGQAREARQSRERDGRALGAHSRKRGAFATPLPQSCRWRSVPLCRGRLIVNLIRRLLPGRFSLLLFFSKIEAIERGAPASRRSVGIEERRAAHVWLPWSMRFHSASSIRGPRRSTRIGGGARPGRCDFTPPLSAMPSMA